MVVVIILTSGFHVKYFHTIQKLKSSLKSDRNWGPEDPMLQHQWHQLSTVSVPANSSFSGEHKETNNVTFLSDHLAASTPNKTGQLGRGECISDSYIGSLSFTIAH